MKTYKPIVGISMRIVVAQWSKSWKIPAYILEPSFYNFEADLQVLFLWPVGIVGIYKFIISFQFQLLRIKIRTRVSSNFWKRGIIIFKIMLSELNFLKLFLFSVFCECFIGAWIHQDRRPRKVKIIL